MKHKFAPPVRNPQRAVAWCLCCGVTFSELHRRYEHEKHGALNFCELCVVRARLRNQYTKWLRMRRAA